MINFAFKTTVIVLVFFMNTVAFGEKPWTVTLEKACIAARSEGLSLSTRKKICRCIVNGHKGITSKQDQKILISRYRGELKILDPIDDSLSILLSHDNDLAEKCLGLFLGK